MIGKSIELVNIIKRKGVDVACVQETKRKGNITKELTDGNKFFYTRKNNAKNGVGLVVDKDFKGKNIYEGKDIGRQTCRN